MPTAKKQLNNMEAILRLEQLLKEIEVAQKQQLVEIEEMQESYINAIGSITDSANILLAQTLKYIELYKEYGDTEDELFENITTFIEETRNLESQLKK
tara:strand:+ start:2311 stop:2604 length:294 start_codon:yes stop_codon:yes gene_type:complete